VWVFGNQADVRVVVRSEIVEAGLNTPLFKCAFERIEIRVQIRYLFVEASILLGQVACDCVKVDGQRCDPQQSNNANNNQGPAWCLLFLGSHALRIMRNETIYAYSLEWTSDSGGVSSGMCVCIFLELKRNMESYFPSMALDQIAECVLRELGSGTKSVGSLETTCSKGAMRLVLPRLAWLEGLGMIENTGADVFRITQLGQRFLDVVTSAEDSPTSVRERPHELDESEIELGKS